VQFELELIRKDFDMRLTGTHGRNFMCDCWNVSQTFFFETGFDYNRKF